MPIYLYACTACGSHHEVRHGINESPPTECPACGSEIERVFTVPRVNPGNYTSPTAAKYAKMTASEEVKDAQAGLEARRRPPKPQ